MAHQLSPEAITALDKVQKLLALAKNNANEAEAQAASAKAMDILAAHNLDMAVVGSSRIGADRDDKKLSGGLYSWQRDLWRAVSELNFCMYWSIKGLARGSKYEHRVLGRQENVIATEVMADYLQQTVERLAAKWAREEGYNSRFVREAIAYREGMVTRLTLRLATLRQERIEEEARKAEEQARRGGNTANAVAIRLSDVIQKENDLNNDFINGWEPGTTEKKREERDARIEAWRAEQREELRLRDEAEAANPALKEARLAEEARKKAESDAYWAKQERKWAAADKRRANTSRRMTAAEERASMDSYYTGYDHGAKVGLDQQVAQSKTRRVA